MLRTTMKQKPGTQCWHWDEGHLLVGAWVPVLVFVWDVLQWLQACKQLLQQLCSKQLLALKHSWHW